MSFPSGGSYPSEISWEIIQKTDSALVASGGFIVSGSVAMYDILSTSYRGNYTLKMVDSYGDGRINSLEIKYYHSL